MPPETARPDLRSWQAPALAGGAALLLLALALARLPVERLVTVVPDDAYFYLKTAWHLGRGDGSTFDGLNVTNGYHPLYLWLLAALSRVVPLADRAGLVAAIWFDTLLTAVWLGVMAALASRLGWRRASIWALVAALLPIAAVGDVGMEVNLLLPLAWGMVLVLARPTPTAADEWRAGLLGAAACLARLDAVLFVGMVTGGLLVARGGVWPIAARHVRTALRLVAPSVVALGSVALLNRALFGHAATVSSWLKSGRQADLVAVGGQFALNPQTILLLGGVAVCVVALGRALVTRTRHEALPAAAAAWAIVYVSVMSVLLRGGLESWYFPMPLAASVMAAVSLFDAATRDRRRLAAIGATAIAIGAVAATALAVRTQIGRGWFFDDALRTARWIDQTLPPDARVFQVDNAGIVAYFAHRAVVNGDGLINSWDYQRALRTNRLPAYLAEQRLGVFVFDEDAGAPLSLLVPLWNAPPITLTFDPPATRLATFGRFAVFQAAPATIHATPVDDPPLP